MLVYVIATRPFPEKIVGDKFYYTHDEAEERQVELEKDGLFYYIYPAIIEVLVLSRREKNTNV